MSLLYKKITRIPLKTFTVYKGIHQGCRVSDQYAKLNYISVRERWTVQQIKLRNNSMYSSIKKEQS